MKDEKIHHGVVNKLNWNNRSVVAHQYLEMRRFCWHNYQNNREAKAKSKMLAQQEHIQAKYAQLATAAMLKMEYSNTER